jgi:hypothetical protein
MELFRVSLNVYFKGVGEDEVADLVAP